jgi:hypothetical protein
VVWCALRRLAVLVMAAWALAAMLEQAVMVVVAAGVVLRPRRVLRSPLWAHAVCG